MKLKKKKKKELLLSSPFCNVFLDQLDHATNVYSQLFLAEDVSGQCAFDLVVVIAPQHRQRLPFQPAGLVRGHPGYDLLVIGVRLCSKCMFMFNLYVHVQIACF